jgi:hypothetical protein
VHEDTQRTLAAIEEAVAGLTALQLAKCVGGKWSPEAVLEHLDLTYSTTVTAMQKTLEKGPRAATAVLRQRIARWLIVRLGYFPSGFKAPEFATPQGRSGDAVLADIRRHLPEMDAAIAAVESKLGAHARVKHPRLGPLTAAEWRRFHLVHTRHHMKQIAAQRAASGGR